MTCVFITDIHGRSDGFDRLPAAEVAVLGGDLTQFGTVADVRRLLGLVQRRYAVVLAVLGNCDPPAGDPILEAAGVGLHLRPRPVGDLTFLGLGGANTTPFHTPYEWADAGMASRLPAPMAAKPASRPMVLVSHAPPLGSGADRLPGGGAAGSSAVARWVLRHRPALVLCGHIHEALGVFSLDGVPVVNPGAYRAGRYALLDLAPDGTLAHCSLGQLS